MNSIQPFPTALDTHMHDLLHNILASDQLYTAVVIIVSPWPIYDGFKRNPDVIALQDAWRNKEIDPDALKSFIETILKEFQPGHYLTKEYVLIALCVALEPFKDEALPKELITSCARCKFVETPMLGHVASFCLNGDPYEVRS